MDYGWKQNQRFCTKKDICRFHNPHVHVHDLKWGICRPDEIPKEYLEPGQNSKMERLAKIDNGFQSLTIFAKKPILDV